MTWTVSPSGRIRFAEKGLLCDACFAESSRTPVRTRRTGPSRSVRARIWEIRGSAARPLGHGGGGGDGWGWTQDLEDEGAAGGADLIVLERPDLERVQAGAEGLGE